MAISTRLTERLGIRHPIIGAPMALASGGALAAAVSRAGGLGMVGGGYGQREWLDREFRAAGNERVGCGFITWSLAGQPELLDLVLERRPAAVFLSFGDPSPFAGKVHASGALLICQVQTRRDAEAALDAGAQVVVAQGGEAGGHGERRATMTLVPEVADLAAARSPQTLVCAAGGIADGRGLAAAMMLGADGVVVGSRFWATPEALVHPNAHAAAVAATGDDTVRQKVTDIARGLNWPARFDIRTLRNPFLETWIGREADLVSAGQPERERYAAAYLAGDAAVAPPIVGEGIGLIDAIEPAGVIVERMVAEAEEVLRRNAARIVP